MELAEIWQCGLSIDSAALAFEAKRSAYKSSKWKHRTTTTVLISPSCEKVGMAWKKRILSPPYLPLCWSESSVFVSPISRNILKKPLATYYQLQWVVWNLRNLLNLSYSTLFYKTINASMKNVEAFWRMVHGGFRRANWTLKWRHGLIKIPGISPRWRILTYEIKPCRNSNVTLTAHSGRWR